MYNLKLIKATIDPGLPMYSPHKILVVPAILTVALGLTGCLSRDDLITALNADAQKRNEQHAVLVQSIDSLTKETKSLTASLVTVSTAVAAIEENEATIARQVEALAAQSPEAQRKQALEDIAVARTAAIGLKDALATTQRQLDELTAKQLANSSAMEAAIAKSMSEAQQQANTLIVAEARKGSSAIEATAKQLEVIGQKFAQRRHDLMELSRALAAKRAADGDRVSSRRYLLNAIYQDPTAAEPVFDYAQSVLTDEKAGLDDVIAAKQLVNGAELTLAADRVSELGEILANLEAKEASFAEASRKSDIEHATVDLATWQILAKVTDDEIAKDSASITKRLDSIRGLAATIAAGGDGEDFKSATHDLEVNYAKWERALRISSALDRIREVLSQKPDPSSSQAPITISAAETLLTGTYIEGRDGLPKPIIDRVTSTQASVRGYSDLVVKAITNETIAQLDTKIHQADAQSKKELSNPGPNPAQPAKGLGARERACRALNGVTQEAQMLTASIADKEQKEKADAYLHGLAQAIQTHRREQYNAYQRWATTCLHEAFRRYKSDKATNENDATEAFNIGQYDKIDQGLLSPEVSQIYSQVWTKLSVEVYVERLLELETRMTNAAEKVRLENF